ncbi:MULTISPECIES: hypothetical protein [Pseudomonas]|uniref:hypothetical protein n=1 Tax=Pseudomonas TaxID=286 RepID=UPI000B356CD4|nr:MULTISPECIES: hypothetical protein [Pseudomonas]PMY71027.1 hypothetical protein C1Y31_01710 [Pseudomonas sp. FW305-25]PMY75556.1 hypothetical protein C1Y32_02735 [Pseudomonas sp. FW126-L8]PNA81422.1 hypothetical protein C1Y33_07720 [Pseudomonas sp. FW305-76]
MRQVVARALDVIALESDRPEYTEAFRAAQAVVTEFGELNLADRLFADIPESIPFLLVAKLFNLLAWQTDDNGSAITRTVERWLVEGTNLRKIQIALNLDVYPFPDEHEMYRVLSDVAISHPEVADKCQQLISSRQNR